MGVSSSPTWAKGATQPCWAWVAKQLKVQDETYLMSAEQLIAKNRGSFLAPEDWREKQKSSKHHKHNPIMQNHYSGDK